VGRHAAARVAREFARNAEVTRGRSMIAMGAGTNHWFHSDQTYRTFLALVMMCGCEGVNGGGWAHYVGQEKVRPLAGWQTVAFALDWVRPPRHQSGTPFFYLASGQWRYERYQPSDLASPLGRGLLDGMHIADVNALGARLGWLPSFPSFDRSTLDLADEAQAAGREPAAHVVEELRSGRLRFACEDPDAPDNHPKVMTVWRSNLLGSSGKGHEYFLKHMLGTTENAVRAADDHRLPDDQQRAVLRRRAAGGDLVREVRPLLHGPAPVRAHVQRGGAAAVGEQDRLGDLQADRDPLLRAGREASRGASRRDRRAAAARHGRRARHAARDGPRLACRRQ
jgi:nitrate reductase alpha subunit